MGFIVRGLKQGYGPKTVLDGISFEAVPGETLGVLGPNGSGKSTLVKTLCGILPHSEGEVLWDGRDVKSIDIKEFARNVAYIPQDNSSVEYNNVFDTVLLGRRPHTDFGYRDEDLKKAAEAVHTMGLEDLSDKELSRISGGQRQKVQIARAIAQEPRMFVLDEPTSALDLRNQNVTMRIMNGIKRRTGAGIIIAVHDLNLALRYCDKVLILNDGGIYSFGESKDAITEKAIYDVYGVRSRIYSDEHGTFVHTLEGLEDDMEWPCCKSH
ncbi:MAG: ABC transporter ATP-binding protein [Thermoplasmatales archaeon]|nr:ABC transporter ATP-binding protein [Thermoplasmatales archaeon]